MVEDSFYLEESKRSQASLVKFTHLLNFTLFISYQRKRTSLTFSLQQWYKRVDNNNDIPSYIKDHRSKFGYMVDRDGEGAGFVDYEEIIEKEKKGLDLI